MRRTKIRGGWTRIRGREIGGAGGAWAPPNFSMGEPSPPTFADQELLQQHYGYTSQS